MDDPSSTSNPTTFDLFGNAISSPASADGRLLSDLQESQTAVHSGPEAVPASPSASLESDTDSMTSEISGQPSFDSFGNVILPSSSANKSRLPAPLLTRMRICKLCGTEKPSSEFYANSKGSLRPSCKSCDGEAERSRKRANPQLTATIQRNWRLNFRGHALTNVAKHRAKTRGIPFDLDPDDIQRRVDNGVCELTGIPFSLDIPRAWNAPSLDQIRPGEGYTKDNVRVILYAVNVMANTWGERRIMEIASAISAKRRSASERLQASLTKALMRQISLHGSPEFSLTWTEQAMPSGGPVCRLAPSVRRTAASGSTGAPAEWGTPTAHERTHTPRRVDHGIQLANQVAAAWPTPQAGTPTQNGYNEAGGTDFSRKVDVIAGLRQTTNGPRAAWPTKARDHKGAPKEAWMRKDGKERDDSLDFQTVLAFGTTPSGASGPTEKRGALDARFVAWLMGYPQAWTKAGMLIKRK